MEDRRMSTNSREPSEQEIEALRESLLNGGFGEEACEDSAEEADFAREDDEAVKRFKAMFGAKGPTPLKGYDDIRELDQLEIFEVTEVARTL